MNKLEAIEKIKKCLNLSKSSNPSESAIALKQMRKLMDQYKVDMGDVHMSMVNTICDNSGGRQMQWKKDLAVMIAKAFDCECYYNSLGFNFVGVDSNAEIALYAYDTLARQLNADRKKYMANNYVNHSRKARNLISYTYCVGWLSQVRSIVDKIVPKQEDLELIKTYMETNLSIRYVKSNTRVAGGVTGEEITSQGKLDGQKANLFHAASGKQQAMIGC